MNGKNGILLYGSLCLVLVVVLSQMPSFVQGSESLSLEIGKRGSNVLYYPGRDHDPDGLLDNGPEFYFYVDVSSNEMVNIKLDYDERLWRGGEVSVSQGDDLRTLHFDDSDFSVPIEGSATLRYNLKFYGLYDEFEDYSCKIIS